MFRAKKKGGPSGGLFFFLSIACLFFLTLINVDSLFVLFKFNQLPFLGLFTLGALVGNTFAATFIIGTASVFFHELKHSIPSNLVGNRAKGMEVHYNHGNFKYEYTKDTAKYNALIALAPYWIPLFTLPVVLIPYLFSATPFHKAHVLAVGIAYGCDLRMNLRDIGPHQTDFSRLRGGYTTGIAYVTLINCTVFTILFAWALAELKGLEALGAGLWHFVGMLMGFGAMIK